MLLACYRTSWKYTFLRLASPLLGEGELDGGKGVTGFEPADFGLAVSVKFLEGQGASAAIGRERGDALEEVSGALKSRTTGSSG
jgi:hypothetical protein